MVGKNNVVLGLIVGFLVLLLLITAAVSAGGNEEEDTKTSLSMKCKLEFKPPSITEGVSSSIDVSKDPVRSECKWLINIF